MTTSGLILISAGVIYTLRYRLFHPALLSGLAGITLWHFVLAAHFMENIRMLKLLGINVNLDQTDNPFTMLAWFINLFLFIIIAIVFSLS